MKIFKVLSLSVIANLIRLIVGVLLNKTISVLTGPTGLVVVSQFQSVIQVVFAIAKFGINGGVTKYTAELSSDPSELNRLYCDALKITLISSVCSAIIILIFKKYLSFYTFGDAKYEYLFVVLALTVIFFSINSLVLSILNGLKKINSFLEINIYQSIVSLVVTLVLVYKYGIEGALIAVTINQSVVFFALMIFRRHDLNFLYLNIKNIFSENSKYVTKLLDYTFMAVVSSILAPSSQYVIRTYISSITSVADAGLWQGINYISITMMTLITSTFSIYYLPRLSEANSKTELNNEIILFLKYITPLSLLGLIFIFIFRYEIIGILFSGSFIGMANLFKFQLIGDFFRILSCVLSFVFVAKAMKYCYVVTEIIFYGANVLLCFIVGSLFDFGIEAPCFSYMLSSVLYFLVVIILANRYSYD